MTMGMQSGTIDCALVVGGQSSGAIYAKEFHLRGIAPVHLPAAPQPPAAYAGQPLAPEFAADLPFDDELEVTVQRLREAPLKRFRPRFVVAGTDQGVERADTLAELLGMSSNGGAMSAVRRDKFLTAALLHASGLNAPLQFRSTDPGEIAAWVRGHPEIHRWVVKPIKSAGSDRVALCDSGSEVFTASSRILGGLNVFGERDEEVMVQEYLTCAEDDNEYVVNTCSLPDPTSGRAIHHVVSIYRYEKVAVNGAPFVYYARHLLPYAGEVQEQLVDYFRECLDALRVRYGPCHGELRMTRRGPALVEANVGRPDGGGVPRLDAICTGSDQVTLTVESLMHPERLYDTFCTSYALKRHGLVAFFICHREGVVRSIPATDVLRTMSSHLDAVFIARVGSHVTPTVDVSSLLGWAFLSHPDREVLEADYRRLREFEPDGLFRID